jgi:hypothetical protein
MKRALVVCSAAGSLAYGAGWQVKETSQWTVRYKGGGTLSVMEGKRLMRNSVFDGSDHFTHYAYEIEDVTSSWWGVAGLLPALMVVENGDAAGQLVVTPKKGVAVYTQPI